MNVISEEKVRENVIRYLDTEIKRQKEIRDHWAGMHDTGEGNSSLYARNMAVAQDCIDFLSSVKRGTSCVGCEVRRKVASLETEITLLQQEIKRFSKD